MGTYIHKVHYYETDKMGITHHSNYIRFMEEARMAFLSEIGYPMTRLEAMGVTSPVVCLSCQYKHPSTYSDEIEIAVTLSQYTGVRLSLSYVMRNRNTGVVLATAASSHCFIDEKGRPVGIKKHFPDFDAALKKAEKNLCP